MVTGNGVTVNRWHYCSGFTPAAIFRLSRKTQFRLSIRTANTEGFSKTRHINKTVKRSTRTYFEAKHPWQEFHVSINSDPGCRITAGLAANLQVCVRELSKSKIMEERKLEN